MDFWIHIGKIALSLFILMDAVGNVPIFISILKNCAPKKQKKIIFRELLIALAVIMVFAFLGEFLLSALGITHDTVMISGGIILFLIALKMIFPNKNSEENTSKLRKEPLIVPLAIPLIAGPAVLAAIMIYAKQEGNLVTIPALILAWAASTAILLASALIRKLLGDRGILACERLMGIILTLISIQMFLEGIKVYVNRCGP